MGLLGFIFGFVMTVFFFSFFVEVLPEITRFSIVAFFFIAVVVFTTAKNKTASTMITRINCVFSEMFSSI